MFGDSTVFLRPGGVQPSPAGLSVGEPRWTFSHAPSQSQDGGLSPGESYFPSLRWPGLEEVSIRAGCDDLTTVSVKSRVHWECTSCPALPAIRLHYLYLGALAQHLFSLPRWRPAAPGVFPDPPVRAPFPSLMPLASLPISLLYWLFMFALVK